MMMTHPGRSEAVIDRSHVPTSLIVDAGTDLAGRSAVQVAETAQTVQLPIVDHAQKAGKAFVHQTVARNVGARVLVIFHVDRLQVERREQIVVILAQLFHLLRMSQRRVNSISMNVQYQIFDLHFADLLEHFSIIFADELTNHDSLFAQFRILQHFLNANQGCS